MALSALGHHGWAVLLFGMALGSLGLLEMPGAEPPVRRPLPPPLRPTLGVGLRRRRLRLPRRSPTYVARLMCAVDWSRRGLRADPRGAGALALVERHTVSAGFWSFSFPVAAFASTIAETVAWRLARLWFYAAALIATALILFLVLRTLLLLLRGRLIPPG